MSQITERLASLNALRIDLGMSVLKSWKESALKLEAAIEKLTAKKAEIVAAGPSIIQKQVEEHKAAVEKIARKANVPVKNVEATVTRLAKELGDKQRKTSPKIKPISKKEIAALQDHNRSQMKKAGLKAHKTGAINVADIASELGINAKVARATLRRKGIDRTDEKAIRAALAKK